MRPVFVLEPVFTKVSYTLTHAMKCTSEATALGVDACQRDLKWHSPMESTNLQNQQIYPDLIFNVGTSVIIAHVF